MVPRPVQGCRLQGMRVPQPLHADQNAQPGPGGCGPAEAGTRRLGCGQGAAGHGRGPAALRAAPGDRKHPVASRARLRPAPDALPRSGQNDLAARGHCRGHRPGSHRRLVRRPAHRAHTHVALCRPRRIAEEFATSVRTVRGQPTNPLSNPKRTCTAFSPHRLDCCPSTCHNGP